MYQLVIEYASQTGQVIGRLPELFATEALCDAYGVETIKSLIDTLLAKHPDGIFTAGHTCHLFLGALT